MIAGITGGVGCGKSTAARAFESRGFRRLDSDQIVREQVLTDPAVIASVRTRYGDAVIETADEELVSPLSETPGPGVPQPQITGRARINRTALAARVFANDNERLWLEELTHPR